MNWDGYLDEVFDCSKRYLKEHHKELDGLAWWGNLYMNVVHANVFTPEIAKEDVTNMVWDKEFADKYSHLPIECGPEQCDAYVRGCALDALNEDIHEYWEELCEVDKINELLAEVHDLLKDWIPEKRLILSKIFHVLIVNPADSGHERVTLSYYEPSRMLKLTKFDGHEDKVYNMFSSEATPQAVAKIVLDRVQE